MFIINPLVEAVDLQDIIAAAAIETGTETEAAAVTEAATTTITMTVTVTLHHQDILPQADMVLIPDSFVYGFFLFPWEGWLM